MSSKNQGSRDPTEPLSQSPTTNRHARDDPDRSPAHDAHSPHDRDDPDTPGLLERMKPSTVGQWSTVFFFVSLMGAGILYVTRLYPPGYHNPYVIVIGALVASYPFVGLWFREQGFRARSMLDTVVIKLGSPTTGIDAMITEGRVESVPGAYRLSKEVKKTSFGGFVVDWLQLEDVASDDDLRLESKRHREPSDPSPLDLDSRFTGVTKTELFGDVYVCDAADIEYDWESRDVERRTTPPSYISEGESGMLIKELEFARQREQAARDEIEVVENRIESLRKRVDDEQYPELKKALQILDRMKDTHLGPRPRRDRLLADERSSAVDRIDEQVDEDMNGGGSK